MSTAQRAAIRRINGEAVYANSDAMRPAARPASSGDRFPETRLTRYPAPIIAE